MKKKIVVIGCGGFAKEVFSWLTHDPKNDPQVDLFYSSDKSKETMYGIPVVHDFNNLKGCFFVVAIGDPIDRSDLFQDAIEHGLIPYEPIIHKSATIGRNVKIGQGSIICPGAIITTDVEIGQSVIVNIGATIGHDCFVDDFVTISPGANISGNCVISLLSYIGTNACLREGIHTGFHSVIGMGAVVVKHVEESTTVVGNPARQLIR